MMNRQAELFEDGGLKDEGGMIDAESGNKVPVGSTREEVRDDIPAKLSEGEFVMPADVVRYHGLDKMMGLRDEAKMGLQKMEAMGQMGNSEEATLPDEMPFGMGDLIVVAGDGREVEMAEGGYVTMAEGGATRALGATYTPPTSQPLDFTTVMGEGKISYKEYRNAEGKNMLVSFIGGIPVYPIPEGYTEYTPGADEPVTPIQEVVQAGPPTPELNDEDRQRAGYEVGYSIGYENMTPIQLLRESKRMNSVFGKIAFAIPMLINPVVGIAAYTALGDKYPQLDAEINKQLKLDPKNKSLLAAAELSTNNKKGQLAGKAVTTIKNFVGDKITQFFGEDTLTKVIELSGVKTNTSENIETVSKEVNNKKTNVPVTVDKRGSTVTNVQPKNQQGPNFTPQSDTETLEALGRVPATGYDFAAFEPESPAVGLGQQDTNARLNLRPVEMDQSPSRGADTSIPQAVLDDQRRDLIRGSAGNVDAANQQRGLIDRGPTLQGNIPFGQFQGENVTNNFEYGVNKSREIADGPGFVESMRDRNRATVDRKTEERRAERDLNRGDYGFNKIYDGSEVYQQPRTSLIDQIRTGRTDTPDLTDALAAGLGYVYDGTVNGYVGKGAVIANDYLRSLPSAVYDLLGMSFKPAGAATMDSVAGQALSVNDMKTVIENNSVSDDISSALRGGFDSSKLERERGILPSGSQVADLGPVTNEQLRQYNQGFITAGDRYAMTMGGRGLRGTRPEGFGDQNLGFVAQDAPEQYALRRSAPDMEQYTPPFEPNMRDRNMRPPGMRNPSMGQEEFSELQRSPVMVDPRDPNFRGSYQGNVPPSNMQGPNFTPDSIDPRGPSQIPDARRPFPTPQLDSVTGLFGPNVGGTSGRLQDFRGGDPFKPLRGAGIGGSNMGTPDNVTDVATRASAQLTGPTTDNYGTRDFNAFGEGVTPGLRQGDVIPYSPNMRDRNITTPGMTAPTNLELKDPLNRFEGPKQEEILRQAQILKDRGIGAVPTSPLVGGGISPQIPATQTPGYLDSGQANISAIQTPGYLDSGGPMPQRSAIETPGYLDSGQANISARDVPSFGDTDPINVVPANEFQLGAADAARENNLRAQEAEETFYDQQGLPSQVDATRMMGINDPQGGLDAARARESAAYGAALGNYMRDNMGVSATNPDGITPSFYNKYPEQNLFPYERAVDLGREMQNKFSNQSTNVYPQLEGVSQNAEANREASLGGADARPRTRATITDSLLDSGMGGAIQSGRSPVSLNAPSMDRSFDPTRQEFSSNMRDRNMRTPGMAQLDDSGMGAAISDATVDTKTSVPKKQTQQTLQTIKKRDNDYLSRRQEVISRSAGNRTLLRSGKETEQNSPQAMYNREQESTGYIGTDSEGYGVGMIAGPGQAGVVVDENGKALKDGPDGRTGKTIYQDSTGVQYTKSTFGKKETLDGKKYTPAEGAKKGDGLDRDNDNEADSGKIICTAMNASYGFGSYRQAIWLNYSNKHLTKAHEVGYHTLFLPLVYLAYTKDIKFIRTLLEHGTRRRTADLRAELKGTKRNTLGRFYRTIFEPLCYTVGKIKIALGN